MNLRPPLLGYNHNVRHAGRLYHVQTEDTGPRRMQVTTHVFLQGVIMATVRAGYAAEDEEAVVQRLMQGQHKDVLRSLRDGAFDEKIAAMLAAHPAIFAPAALAEVHPLGEVLAEGGAAVPELVAPVATTRPRGIAPLSDSELAELVDIAADTLDGAGAAFSGSSSPDLPAPAPGSLSEGSEEEEQVLEMEAEPPSEEELRALQEAAPPAEAPPAPPPPTPVPEDLPPVPTRVRLFPASSGGMGPGGPRGMGPRMLRQPPPRSLRTTAQRLDAMPFRSKPMPTAEGVLVKRPVIMVGGDPAKPPETDPKVRPMSPGKPAEPAKEQPSLDQVVLAYLAEDSKKK